MSGFAKARRAVIIAIGAFIGFVVYSGLRTLGETVGFDFGATLTSLVFTLLYFLTIAGGLSLLLSGILRRRWRCYHPTLLIFCASLVGGSAAGEAAVLYDERAFALEAAQHHMAYSRDRSWPNESSMLCASPTRGIWATD